MYYLAEMNEDQMLVMNSGHPQGLYPAFPDSPRLVISNGLVNYLTAFVLLFSMLNFIVMKVIRLYS